MEFRTQIPIKSQEPKIGYCLQNAAAGLLFCGKYREETGLFQVPKLSLNPFGILFHPAAIHNFLKKGKIRKKFLLKPMFFTITKPGIAMKHIQI